jgi:tetrahydromethanopterin S-methyltransferase subunit E
MVQHVGVVPQFNKIAHLTGRTSMERFSMNAKVACEQTVESIDKVKTKYALVLGYFGEDENMSTGDFFGILRKFMSEWKTAIKQVEKIERAHVSKIMDLLVLIFRIVSRYRLLISSRDNYVCLFIYFRRKKENEKRGEQRKKNQKDRRLTQERRMI